MKLAHNKLINKEKIQLAFAPSSLILANYILPINEGVKFPSIKSMILELKEKQNVLAGYVAVDNKFHIKRVYDLNVSQPDDIEKKLDKLFEFNRHLQVLSILTKNEKELLEKIDNHRKNTPHSLLVAPNMGENNWHFVEVNRAVLNLLSSLKTFLDFSETFLRRKYGKDSDEIKIFKEAQSAQFDGSFSYRFCYKLRNYAQHCGLPVGGFDTETIQLSKSESLSHVILYLERDVLIKNFDWGKKIEDEIYALDERFELGSHLINFVECIQSLCNTLINIEKEDVMDSLEYIEELISSVKKKYPDMRPVLYKFKTSNKDYGDLFWLPTDLVKEIREVF